MRGFFNAEKWFQAGEDCGSELGRREGGRDCKNIGQDVWEKMRIFHLDWKSSIAQVVENNLLTSSTREGRIFRIRRPSENLSRTVVNPFIKDIFSSLVFEVKFDRSKKFKVDIGSDEKKD